MSEEAIERVGFTITQSRQGAYWDVTLYVRFSGHTGMRDVHYWNLSQTEMADVILANLDDYAPGTRKSHSGDQHQLWDGALYSAE